MRPQTLITLVVVLGSGLFAGLASYQMLNRAPDANAGKKPVLVAKVGIPRGTLLEADKNFEVRMVDETLVNDDVLPGDPAVIQKLLADKFVATLPVRERDLLRKGSVGPANLGVMEQKLDKAGSRAVSVPITTPRAVAGFVKPGCRVDLALISTVGNKRQANIFLENVEVLGVDLESQNVSGPGGKDVRMMTFLADREQSLRISLASTAGEIVALLRGAIGDDGKAVPVVDLRSLTDGGIKQATDEAVALSADEQQAVESNQAAAFSLLDSVTASAPMVRESGAAPDPVQEPATVKVMPFRNVEGKVLFYVPVPADSPLARSMAPMLEDPSAATLDEMRRTGGNTSRKKK